MNFAELRDALNQVLAKNDLPAVTETPVVVVADDAAHDILVEELNIIHTHDAKTLIYLRGRALK